MFCVIMFVFNFPWAYSYAVTFNFLKSILIALISICFLKALMFNHSHKESLLTSLMSEKTSFMSHFQSSLLHVSEIYLFMYMHVFISTCRSILIALTSTWCGLGLMSNHTPWEALLTSRKSTTFQGNLLKIYLYTHNVPDGYFVYLNK